VFVKAQNFILSDDFYESFVNHFIKIGKVAASLCRCSEPLYGEYIVLYGFSDKVNGFVLSVCSVQTLNRAGISIWNNVKN